MCNYAYRISLSMVIVWTSRLILKDGKQVTYRFPKVDMIDLEKERACASEHVAGGESEFKGTAHKEASKDATVHVPLLRLTDYGVLQFRVANQHGVRVC